MLAIATFGQDRWVARPAKFDDDVVLDRAVDLFWERGVDAVSIRDLETALELRAPSIYRRFASKDVLLARCIDHYIDREVEARVGRYLDQPDDPLRGLHGFFTSVLRPHPGEHRLRGCLLTVTAGRSEASTPEVRRRVDRGFETIESGLRRQVERAAAAGQLDAGIDATAAARFLLLAFQGLLVLARSGAGDLPAGIEATFAALGPVTGTAS